MVGRGQVWSGGARSGEARRGWAGQARQGMAGRGAARFGRAGQGQAGRGRRGKAWSGAARHGRVRSGLAWRGRAGQAWQGQAGLGSAGCGRARLGWTGQGRAGGAWQHTPGRAARRCSQGSVVMGSALVGLVTSPAKVVMRRHTTNITLPGSAHGPHHLARVTFADDGPFKGQVMWAVLEVFDGDAELTFLPSRRHATAELRRRLAS